MATPVMEKHNGDAAAHCVPPPEALAVGDGPHTWHGILSSLVSICNPNSVIAFSVGDVGATVKEELEDQSQEVEEKGPSQDAESAALPAAESKSHNESSQTGASSGVNSGGATLFLIGDRRADGPEVKLAVESVLAVSLVERLPVFHELGLAPANRICMLDVRFLEGSQKRRLCVRSLSQRVSVNGKPVGDGWQPLAEGDAIGFGHADGADSDARTVYAVTYLLEEQEHRHAMALAFARDALASYEIELPPGAVEEAGVANLVCQPSEGDSSMAGGTCETWEARAKRAHDELLAVGAVARAIVESGRRHFMEWAKDEAAAHGVSFGSRTEKALNDVGVAIAKCYEDSGFTLPPAMYWAVEGLVKCTEIMQHEAAHYGEMDSAASMLQQLVASEAAKEEHALDLETVNRIVQVLVGEFDAERQLDPESVLQSVVDRVWRDFGKDEVQSFVRGTAKWTEFHLKVRARITDFSKKVHFAKSLSEFLRSLTESRGSYLSLDVLNHALSLALAKGNSSAIETVLSVYRVRGEVNAGTFQAWLLQARRSSGWSSIAEVMTRGALAEDHVPLLTQALISFAQSLTATTSLPDGKSPALAQATDAEAALLHATDNLKGDDEQVSSEEDIARSDDGDADQQDDELVEEADWQGEEEGHQMVDDEQVENEDDEAEAEEFESGDVSDDLAPEEEKGRDTAMAHSQRAQHWLAAMLESLPTQLARPRAAKSIQQELHGALRRDEKGTFRMHWEHALVFADCPPLFGFHRERDLKRALRDTRLQHLKLVRVDAQVRSDTTKSNNNNHKDSLPDKAKVAARSDTKSNSNHKDSLLDKAKDTGRETRSNSHTPRRHRRSTRSRSREDSGKLRIRSRGRSTRRQVPALVGARPKRTAKAEGRENRRMCCEPRKEPYAAVDQEGIVVLYKPPYWSVTTTANATEEAAITSKAPRIQTWLTTNLGSHYSFIAQNPRAGLVHRLDVQTSGPILVATNAHTFEEMRCNLRQKTWYKEYIALMHGTVPPKRATGVLNYKLFTQRDRGSGWRTEVNHKKGEDAETKYEALEAYRCRTLEKGSRQRFTLMRLQLITGRTHQIRVHLAEFARELGLQVRGIVGDYKYLTAEQAKADRRLCQRVFLHAQKLHFPPPANKGPLFQVSCPLPPELQRVLSKLEKDERTTEQFKDKARREPALPVDHDSEAVVGTARLTKTNGKRCRADTQPAPNGSKSRHRGGSSKEPKCKKRCHAQ